MFAFVLVGAAIMVAPPASSPSVERIVLTKAPPRQGEVPKLLSVTLQGDGESHGKNGVPVPIDASGTPTGSGLVSLFSQDDYPAEAMRKGEEGTSTVRLDVDAAGRVTGCSVIDTSKSPSLDAATCRVLSERARFTPAKGPDGRAVAEHYTQRVRWLLPKMGPAPFADSRGRMLMTFDGKGAISGCRSDERIPESVVQQNCASLAATIPPWITEKERAGRTMVFEAGFAVGGPEAAQTVGRSPEHELLSMVGLALSINANGDVVGCTLAGPDRAMPAAQVEKACAGPRTMHYEPLDAAAADRSDRHGVSYYAAYFDRSKG